MIDRDVSVHIIGCTALGEIQIQSQLLLSHARCYGNYFTFTILFGSNLKTMFAAKLPSTGYF